MGWDGLNAFEHLIGVKGRIQRRREVMGMLEACIEAKNRPQLVRKAREAKERLRRKLAQRMANPGLYVDVTEDGKTHISAVGNNPSLDFSLPSNDTSSLSSFSSSSSPLAKRASTSSVAIDTALAAEEPRRSARQMAFRRKMRSQSAPPSPPRENEASTSSGTAKKPVQFRPVLDIEALD
ncbi:hypothetical protein SISSUDRAFT_1068014 [Sistotremastrum suecicum HHB10207 ss-3]|uniref:Uncharacterized protein n=1 Tax=Sistotremastrum suecicum HHB10207 ss-3 TaxID=1314776 RepID=A0A165WHS9_9AGAM|nr:hypothetical protein SISSUDRAFT_1068014 [Sistotremastrum suecicum HHB10207 ss-3]